MAGLPWEVLYPKSIAVYLSGELNGWAAPKDIILYVAGQLTVAGATNAIVEYIGPGARTLSATGKATIANMGAEIGATTSIFPYDPHMATYLHATGRGELVPPAASNVHLLTPDDEVEADPESYYDRVVRLDLTSLEPHVVGPHSPDRARPISHLVAEIADAQQIEDIQRGWLLCRGELFLFRLEPGHADVDPVLQLLEAQGLSVAAERHHFTVEHDRVVQVATPSRESSHDIGELRGLLVAVTRPEPSRRGPPAHDFDDRTDAVVLGLVKQVLTL